MAEESTNEKPRNHPSVPTGKVGVLLVNLGTPDGHDTASVRRYLAEFLSDRRVIEASPLVWKPILHGIILRTRPPKVAEAYRKIWRQDTNESPLRYFTRRQAELLGEALGAEEKGLRVSWAMRYGHPSLGDTLTDLQSQGCERILLVPLYPQYSATTTATVTDKVFERLRGFRWQPTVRILAPYYDHPAYIEAIAGSMERYLGAGERRPELVLASYHGLPQEYFDAGDPYYCHCAKTTRLVQERLGCDQDFIRMSFQSRFGPKKWLQPYTSQTLIELAKEGRKHVAVIMPGFAADCLETLEEMGVENRKLFLEHGGERYDVIPCLNDSPEGVAMLADLARGELCGWVEF